jgi:exoribonuclease-2
MTRSTVEPRPSRHASLALDSYVQFTSPIRRYTDLIAHWNVKAFLRGTPAPFSASDIETITAVAAEASREVGRAEGEVTKYWVAEYLRQRWQDSWAATFLGWFRRDSQLAAVLLEELGVETILRVRGGRQGSQRVFGMVAGGMVNVQGCVAAAISQTSGSATCTACDLYVAPDASHSTA